MIQSEDLFLREHYIVGTNLFLLMSVPVCPFENVACLVLYSNMSEP